MALQVGEYAIALHLKPPVLHGRRASPHKGKVKEPEADMHTNEVSTHRARGSCMVEVCSSVSGVIGQSMACTHLQGYIYYL